MTKGEIVHVTVKEDFNPSNFRDSLNMKKKLYYAVKKNPKEPINAQETD